MVAEVPLDIFLAHTAALIPGDREFLNCLEARLSGQGYRVYSSLRDPLVGSVLHGLESRIERASVGLLAMNHRYAKTAWSRLELWKMTQRRDWTRMSLLAFWMGGEGELAEGVRPREVIGVLPANPCARDLDQLIAKLWEPLRAALRRHGTRPGRVSDHLDVFRP
jgi:hypothetical protein